MDSPEKLSGHIGGLLEGLKQKAIKEGRWLGDNTGPDPSGAPQKNEFKNLKKAKKDKEDEKRNRFDHRRIQIMLPGVFYYPGLWVVYDYCWRFAKKTRTGKLRWSGYIKTVSVDLNRSYSQVRRDFQILEERAIFHRWNTGKRFPKNIKMGLYPKYHQTVITIVWNAADLKRQKILAKKAAKKKKENQK